MQTGRQQERANHNSFKSQANKPKEVIVCTFCSKPGHSENTCYTKFGKPTHFKAGPQDSSTPMKYGRKPGKAGAHPSAAMCKVYPPLNNYLTFVNSNFKDNVVSPDQIHGGLESKDREVEGLESEILDSSGLAFLELSEEGTPIMAAYTVQNSCLSYIGKNKLNPYSEANHLTK